MGIFFLDDCMFEGTSFLLKNLETRRILASFFYLSTVGLVEGLKIRMSFTMKVMSFLAKFEGFERITIVREV